MQKMLFLIFLLLTGCADNPIKASTSSESDSPSLSSSPSPEINSVLQKTEKLEATTNKCATEPFSAFTSNREAIKFPASGKFVLESHLATNSDSFSGGRLFPRTVTENIQVHLDNSCHELKKINANIDCAAVYKTRYHNEWTPPEHGKAGQGSVGDVKPTIQEEMYSGNMMWAPGKKPAAGTKFLASFNGKTVVFVMGYETGPNDSRWLG
ncbi:MAG TPA: hypothetical protein VIE65_13620, partial [Methylobacter sp.]